METNSLNSRLPKQQLLICNCAPRVSFSLREGSPSAAPLPWFVTLGVPGLLLCLTTARLRRSEWPDWLFLLLQTTLTSSLAFAFWELFLYGKIAFQVQVSNTTFSPHTLPDLDSAACSSLVDGSLEDFSITLEDKGWQCDSVGGPLPSLHKDLGSAPSLKN